MGQKAHPIGFRVGVIKSRGSEWYAKSKKQSQQFFVEDVLIRNIVDEYYKRCGISKVVIRKTAKEGELIIFTAKVGLIMGKNGEKIKELEKKLSDMFGKQLKVNVKNIKSPELSARVMADHIATQLEGRMPFRRVAKMVVEKIMEKGALGVKVQVKGRLGGTDIARMEKFSEGRVPLQTLRADIDYYYTIAQTKYGVVGIKVWIAKGEVYGKKSKDRKIDLDLDLDM